MQGKGRGWAVGFVSRDVLGCVVENWYSGDVCGMDGSLRWRGVPNGLVGWFWIYCIEGV